MIVLILGSGPNVVECKEWPREPIDHIVAINNAWSVRPDWDFLIHPDDFPTDRQPTDLGAAQSVIRSTDYVPIQNQFGGFLYAGGTMAFTAGYWALGHLQPTVIAFLGCDMTYDAKKTHFYGQGTADPLREDKSLRSLEAKASRFEVLAAQEGCAVLNLSSDPSRLSFPRAELKDLPQSRPLRYDEALADVALKEEGRLDYVVPSGKYWKEEHRFDEAAIDALDQMWLKAGRPL